MAYVITRRDEDGTWYACSGTNARITTWSANAQEQMTFETEAYAKTIAANTTAYTKANYPEHIVGPCKVRKL